MGRGGQGRMTVEWPETTGLFPQRRQHPEHTGPSPHQAAATQVTPPTHLFQTPGSCLMVFKGMPTCPAWGLRTLEEHGGITRAEAAAGLNTETQLQISDSQLEVVLPLRAHLALSGDILTVTTRGLYWRLVSTDQTCC